MRPTMIKAKGFEFPGLYAKNNVPKWQTIHQTNDGLRQWYKGPRAKYMLYPYYALYAASTIASVWMMVRQVGGYKTFWGSK